MKYRGSFISIACVLSLSACSTTAEKVEPMPKLPEVPSYAHVSHPQGYDLTDIKMMFYSKLAPKPEDMKGCDAEMLKLRTATTSVDEISQGARELVLKDPVKYHWCFYAKILEINEAIKSPNVYWGERQKMVLETYLTMVPIARAFKLEYGDIRYLRAATRQYKQMSEWVFFRKLELTPEGTQELMDDVSNPFSLWKKPELAETSVLEKYGMSKSEPNPMGLPMPEERTPAALKVDEAKLPQPVAPLVDTAPAAPAALPKVDEVAPTAAAPAAVPAPTAAQPERLPAQEPVAPAVAPSP